MKKPTSLQIVMLPIGSLIPYAMNAKTHDAAQISKVAASIKEFGWCSPLLIDPDNGIIAGHCRLLAALKLEMTEVPCYVLDHLTDAQRRAYILADNRLAMDGGYDMAILAAEVERLMGEGMDIQITGFDKNEIDRLMQKTATGLTDENDIPEAPLPVSVLGDIWICGDISGPHHRIGCGDSTSATAVAALLAGAKPHLMVTDPPYGVEYDASWRVRAGVNMATAASGKVLNDDRADWSEAWALFPGDVAYVWHGGLHAGEVQASLENNGFKMRSQIIWNKNTLVMGRGDLHWKHEPCWYAVREGKTGHWASDRKQTTVWDIDKPQKSETGHSTQKPVECMRRPMLNNSAPGDIIYDPFLGSSTSILAAATCGRVCYGMELSPAYVDLGVMRWMAFTGKTATHAVTGAPFIASAKLEKTA